MMKKVYKKTVALAIVFCAGQGAIAQPQIFYSTAFHYIQSLNKGREIVASDTLVVLPLYPFRAELSGYWRKDKDITETMVDSADWGDEPDKTIQWDFLKQLNTKGAKPTHLIYFSSVSFDHMLIAQIMPKKRGAGLSHDDQSLFNSSTQYLFIFDESGKIKKVFVHRNDGPD